MGAKPSRPAQPYPAFIHSSEAIPAFRRAVLIANPTSGGGKGRTVAARVLAVLVERGVEVTTIYTTHAGHAREIGTYLGPGYDLVVSVGGDGTAHELINGLSYGALSRPGHHLPLLLLVPCGSGNTLAFNCGVLTPEDALQALTSGVLRRIDLLECSRPDDSTLPRLLSGGSTQAAGAPGHGSTAGEGVAAETGAGVGVAATPSLVPSSASRAPPVGASDVVIDVHPNASSPPTATGSSTTLALTAPTVAADAPAFVTAWQQRVVYSCNMVGWALSTAVMEGANNLRWLGGAQYNCAAYGSLIANRSYLGSIEFVRPGAAQAIDVATFTAGREQLATSLAGRPFTNSVSAPVPSPAPTTAGIDVASDAASGSGSGTPLIPVQPVPTGILPLTMVQIQTTAYMGSKMAFCPFAKLDDGLMDVCVVVPASRMELIGVMDAAKDHGRHVLGAAAASRRSAKRTIMYSQAEEVVLRPVDAVGVEAWKRGEAVAGSPAVDASVARERSRANVHAMIGVNSLNIDGELSGFSPVRMRMLPRVLPLICIC